MTSWHDRSVKILRCEYHRLASTITSNGWAPDAWEPPQMTVKWLHTRGAIGGLWSRHVVKSALWGEPVEARSVTLRVGPNVGLGWVYQVMAHELTHDLTHEGLSDQDALHGDQFRTFLRRLVRTHWPTVPKWQEVTTPGQLACYAEDNLMAMALQSLYPHVGPQRDVKVQRS